MREDMEFMLIMSGIVLIIMLLIIGIFLLLSNRKKLNQIRVNIKKYIHFNKWMEQYIILIKDQRNEIEELKKKNAFQVKQIELLEWEIEVKIPKSRFKRN